MWCCWTSWGDISQPQLVRGFLFLCTQLSLRSWLPLPLLSTPLLRWLEMVWSGFWVGGRSIMWGIQAAAVAAMAAGRRYSTNHFFYRSTPGSPVPRHIVWMNDQSILAVNISCSPFLIFVGSVITCFECFSLHTCWV